MRNPYRIAQRLWSRARLVQRPVPAQPRAPSKAGGNRRETRRRHRTIVCIALSVSLGFGWSMPRATSAETTSSVGCETPSFSPSTIGAGDGPQSVAVGDFNLDGQPDLAVANFIDNNVTFLLGNGSGGFSAAPASPVDAGDGPQSVAVGDFNRDGRPDLAVANALSVDVTLLLGDGLGAFSASTVDVGVGPFSVAVGDFNWDGQPDLAVANSSADDVTLLLNTCTANSPPTLSPVPVALQQGAAGLASPIATVSDAQDPADSLTVDAISVPAGLSVTGITIDTDGTVRATLAAACTATLGPNTVGLQVTDSAGLTATADLPVSVTASQPPVLTLQSSFSPFPNDHKYRTVSMSQMVQSASDDCNGNLLTAVVIEQVTSDEPDNAPGNSDGNTTRDIVIARDCKSVQLRAERDEAQNGRVYTVTLRLSDGSGNTTRGAFKVTVPPNQSGAQAVDDGPRPDGHQQLSEPKLDWVLLALTDQY